MSMVRDLLNEQRTFVAGQKKGNFGNKGTSSSFSKKSPKFSSLSGDSTSEKSSLPASKIPETRTKVALTKTTKKDDEETDAQSEASLVQSVVQRWRNAFKRDTSRDSVGGKADKKGENSNQGTPNQSKKGTPTQSKKGTPTLTWKIPSIKSLGPKAHSNKVDDDKIELQSTSTEYSQQYTDIGGTSKQGTSKETEKEKSDAAKSRIPTLQSSRRMSGSSESEKEVNDSKDKAPSSRSTKIPTRNQKDIERMAESYGKLKINKDNKKVTRVFFKEWMSNAKRNQSVEKEIVTQSSLPDIKEVSESSKTENTNGDLLFGRGTTGTEKSDKALLKAGFAGLRRNVREIKLARKFFHEWRKHTLKSKFSSKMLSSTDKNLMKMTLQRLKENANHNKFLREVIRQWRITVKLKKISERFMEKSDAFVLTQVLLNFKRYTDERKLLRKVMARWKGLIMIKRLKESRKTKEVDESSIEAELVANDWVNVEMAVVDSETDTSVGAAFHNQDTSEQDTDNEIHSTDTEHLKEVEGKLRKLLLRKTFRLWMKEARNQKLRKKLLRNLAAAEDSSSAIESDPSGTVDTERSEAASTDVDEKISQIEAELKAKLLRKVLYAWRKESRSMRIKEKMLQNLKDRETSSGMEESELGDASTTEESSAIEGASEIDQDRKVEEMKRKLQLSLVRRIFNTWRQETKQQRIAKARVIKTLKSEYQIKKKPTLSMVQNEPQRGTSGTSKGGKGKGASIFSKVFGAGGKFKSPPQDETESDSDSDLEERVMEAKFKLEKEMLRRTLRLWKKNTTQNRMLRSTLRYSDLQKQSDYDTESISSVEVQPIQAQQVVEKMLHLKTEPEYQKGTEIVPVKKMLGTKYNKTSKDRSVNKKSKQINGKVSGGKDIQVLQETFRKLQNNSKDTRLLRGSLNGLHTHSQERQLLRKSIQKLKANVQEIRLKREGFERLKKHAQERRISRNALIKLQHNARDRKNLRLVLQEWKRLCHTKVKGKDEGYQVSKVSYDNLKRNDTKISKIRQIFETRKITDSDDTESYRASNGEEKEDDNITSDDVSSVSTIIDKVSYERQQLLSKGFSALRENVENCKLLLRVIRAWRDYAKHANRRERRTMTGRSASSEKLSHRKALSTWMREKTKISDSESDDSDSDEESRFAQRKRLLRLAFYRLYENSEDRKLKRRAFYGWRSMSEENLLQKPRSLKKGKSDSWPSLRVEEGRSSDPYAGDEDLTPKIKRSKLKKDLTKSDSRAKKISVTSSEFSDDSKSSSWIANMKTKFQSMFQENSLKQKPVKGKNVKKHKKDHPKVNKEGLDEEPVGKGDQIVVNEFNSEIIAGGIDIEKRKSKHADKKPAKEKLKRAGSSKGKGEEKAHAHDDDVISDNTSASSIDDLDTIDNYFDGFAFSTKEMDANQGSSVPAGQVDNTCPQCSRLYQCPVLLKCAHTLCKDCVTILVETSIDNSFMCPLCKSITRLSDADEELFCPNFVILHEMEVLEKEMEKLPCVSCKKPAHVFCQTCKDLLCDDCATAHKKVRYTKDHALSPVSEYRRAATDVKEYFCTKHPAEKLAQYCTVCNLSTCEECANIEHKGNLHELIGIDEAGNAARKEIDEVEVDLSSRMSELKLAVRDINRVKDALEDQVMYVKEEIRESFERMVQALADRIRELHAQVEDIHQDKVDKLDDQGSQLRLRIIQLRNTKALMEKLKTHDNDVEMLQMKSTLMTNVNEIETVESLEPQVEKDAFFFKSNEKAVKTEINKHGQIKHVDNEMQDLKDKSKADSSSEYPESPTKVPRGFRPSNLSLVTDSYDASKTENKSRNITVSPEDSDVSLSPEKKKLLTMEEVTSMIRDTNEATETDPETPRVGKGASKDEGKGKSRAGQSQPVLHEDSDASKQTSIDTNPYSERSPEKTIVQQLISSRGEQVNVLKFGVKDQSNKTRDVEVKLTSPDQSIVSAHINENDNGTFTIFCCPRIDDDFNLFVSVGGSQFRKEKKVLNFFGTFAPLSKKEVDLACRTIGLLRWHFTPGLLERKHGKVVPGRTLKSKQ